MGTPDKGEGSVDMQLRDGRRQTYQEVKDGVNPFVLVMSNNAHSLFTHSTLVSVARGLWHAKSSGGSQRRRSPAASPDCDGGKG